MHLICISDENGWTRSKWELTYRVGWEQLVKSVAFASDFYEQFEVLVDDKPLADATKESIIAAPEAGSICFRGISKILKVPVMITFYNQSSTVTVTVAQATDEFKTVAYVNFNHSMCQYMDSIELAMHR